MMKSIAHDWTALKEISLFLKRWLDNPLQLGAVLPSSHALAKRIAHYVVLENIPEDAYILEIGAGTGRLTQALLEVVPADKIICLEIDPSFCALLRKRFPNINVVQGNACNLKGILPASVHGKIAITVSGIPMMSLSMMVQKQIISNCFSMMQEKGKLFQLTYCPFSSIRSSLFHLRKRRLGTIFINFPPASIWCYEQNGHTMPHV